MTAADTERADDNVQAMRDQGIEDACAGRPPKYRLSGGLVFEVVGKRGGWVIPTDSKEYRSAFAYARAYEANR